MKTTLKQMAKFSGIAMVAFLMAQCTPEENEPNKPTRFDLPDVVADFPDIAKTKALVSGEGIVSCTAEDELRIFVETVGQKVNNWEEVAYKYVTSEEDCNRGLFRPEEPLVLDNPASKINMYMVSPYSELIADPVGSIASAFSLDKQVQDYNDLTAHLSDYTLMTGVAENVAAGQTPEFKVEHKTALLKFTIENQLRKPLTIQTVGIKVPEEIKIGGTYAVDCKAGAPLVPVEATNYTTLTLLNSPVLQADGTTDIYIMTPAFSLKKDQVVKLVVMSDSGSWEKIVTVPSDMDIKPGSLNTLTVKKDDSRMLDQVWVKTTQEMGFKNNPYITGVAMNDKYILMQQYNHRIHVYDRQTGEINMMNQAGPDSYMFNATTDDAGNIYTSRVNTYSAGFRLYRTDPKTGVSERIFSCLPKVDDVQVLPAEIGQRISICGDLNSGMAYVYTTAVKDQSIYVWAFKDGVIQNQKDNDEKQNRIPFVVRYEPAGKPWDYASVQRATTAQDSEHYISYVQADAKNPEIGGSKFQIVDKDMKVSAELNPANHWYRILDFKVFKMGNKTLLATLEQDFWKHSASRIQIFDISERSRMQWTPDTPGYENFLLASQEIYGVTNWNQWAGMSISVKNDKEVAIAAFLCGIPKNEAFGVPEEIPSKILMFNFEFFK